MSYKKKKQLQYLYCLGDIPIVIPNITIVILSRGTVVCNAPQIGIKNLLNLTRSFNIIICNIINNNKILYYVYSRYILPTYLTRQLV